MSAAPLVTGKKVLIAGGGGFIGSHLARCVCTSAAAASCLPDGVYQSIDRLMSLNRHIPLPFTPPSTAG